ncbi:MAG: CocE/NonD family hydrolase [Rhizobiaceae bacterium]|nr:CocE/NonD family hydrolase [Rhizobiaceae bacterium]
MSTDFMDALSQPDHEVRMLYDQRAPLRDGVELSADVYLPLAEGPWPTIVQWTPYESTRDRFIAWGVWFAKRGYAAIVIDTRGRYESDGEFVAWTRDGEDAYDSVDWVVKQPWSNGDVGTWGRSYGAIVQWQLARLRHPAIRCMSPAVICDDYYADCHYLGGAFQLALSVGAAMLWHSAMAIVTGPSARDTVLNDRVLRHLPLGTLDEAAVGKPLETWKNWLRHPNYDDYWRSLDHKHIYEHVDVPMLQQGGWFDAYPGAMMRQWQGVREQGATELARNNQRVLMGPWSHEEESGRRIGDLDFGPEAESSVRSHELRFYDHWLKGNDTGMAAEPPISLFTMGIDKWRHVHEWPLPGTTYQKWYLHSGGAAQSIDGDGVFSATMPARDEPSDSYRNDPLDPVPTIGGNNSIATMMQNSSIQVGPGPSDQTPIEKRRDVLVYTSEVLAEDLEVTGPLEAVLYASSDARDCDFVLRLSDVHPDGRSIFVAEGILRARHRNGFERTDLLEPGKMEEFRIRCYPTSMVFLKGHRLRVTVASSSFPRISSNLQSGGDIATDTRADAVVATQTVFHTAQYPSHLLLPVVPA